MHCFANILLLIVLGQSSSYRPTKRDQAEEVLVDIRDVNSRQLFGDHVRRHQNVGGMRTNGDVKVRFSNFIKSRHLIREHNQKTSNYRMEENMFMTMTPDEMKLKTGLANVSSVVHKRSLGPRSRLQLREVAPQSYDHRNEDHVSRVTDQGDCGSCWAYATVYPLEGAISILSGRPAKELSVQEVFSCSYEDEEDRNGCEGGWYMDGWNYVKNFARLAHEGDEPYLGIDMHCDPDINSKQNAFNNYRVVDWDQVPEGDDASLALFSSKHVLAVAVESLGLFFYGEGLFEDEYCELPAAVDHAVTLVGYTTTTWLVKNSWGTDWGERGYVNMARSIKNHCGISDYAYFPIVEKNEEKNTIDKKDKKKKKKKNKNRY